MAEWHKVTRWNQFYGEKICIKAASKPRSSVGEYLCRRVIPETYLLCAAWKYISYFQIIKSEFVYPVEQKSNIFIPYMKAKDNYLTPMCKQNQSIPKQREWRKKTKKFTIEMLHRV